MFRAQVEGLRLKAVNLKPEALNDEILVVVQFGLE
jgi:hypothetical protein